MAAIVGVHGVGQQHKGEDTLRDEWLPALRDGMRRAGVEELPGEADVFCAFYGDLFRREGVKGLADPPLDASDVAAGLEQELLEAWWREAAATEQGVPGPEDKTKVRTPRLVQRALLALSHSVFFSGVAERALIFNLKQVSSYMGDEAVRDAVRGRVVAAIGADTRVVVGHSLGSVVAYEVLCDPDPAWAVDTLVTLGSPLGIPNLIFDRLHPPPRDGIGVWPGTVRRWVNVADNGDIVALRKKLSPSFGGRVEDRLIHNGATAHDIGPYLTPQKTGEAIAGGFTR